MVYIVRSRFFLFDILLRRQENLLGIHHALFDRTDGPVTADVKMRDHSRKNDHPAKRNRRYF